MKSRKLFMFLTLLAALSLCAVLASCGGGKKGQNQVVSNPQAPEHGEPAAQPRIHARGLKFETKEMLKDIPLVSERELQAMLPDGVPASVDLSSHFPPVGNQGGVSSCSGWAIGYYVMCYLANKDENWGREAGGWTTSELCSPAFTYNQTNLGQNIGTYFTDHLKVATRMGVSSWADMPYSPDPATWYPDTEINYAGLPSKQTYLNAIFLRADSYQAFPDDPSSIDAVKEALAAGDGVMIGINTAGGPDDFDDFNASTHCVDTQVYTDENSGHALAIVGYDDNFNGSAHGCPGATGGAFKVINSWGDSWGADGFFWMTYNGALNNVYAAYRILDKLDYSPTIIAEINITHAVRGYLNVSFQAGTHPSPVSSFLLLGNAYMVYDQRANIDLWADLTDLAAYYPPNSSSNIWSVKVENQSGSSSGAINTFRIQKSGRNLHSYDEPVTIGVSSTAYADIAPMSITSITPSSGNTGSIASITNLAGKSFSNTSTVKLTKAGQSDIAASGVTVVNPEKITCSFNLSGAAQGTWNVVVTNTIDGTTAALTNGFTVSSSAGPAAVTLSAPAYITSSSMKLTWTQNNDSDFLKYKVLYSLTSGGTLTTLTNITDKSITAFYATGLTDSTRYYFKVYVYDTDGLYAASNEVNATTLNTAPAAVTLSAPSYITSSSMKLTWTQNNNSDFAYYKVLYSMTSGGTLTTLTTITDKSTAAVYVTGLTDSTKYYFKVYVYDTGGLYAASNEVNATTLQNQPPAAVTLSPPSGITASSMNLAWTQNNDSDFSKYKVFYSLTSGGTLTSLTTITTKTTTTYTVTGLTLGIKYYFKVYVYDTGGLYAASNEVNATTLNTAPAAVTLSAPSYITSSSMKLTWTQNNDSDFSKYKVLYSLNSGGTLTTLATITDKSTTAVYATGLTSSTKYYFKVYVYDTGGLYAGSNEVNATTLQNLPPAAVTLSPPSGIATSSLNLAWTQNNDSDFSKYKVFYSMTSGGTLTSLATITVKTTTTYTVTGLTLGTKYYFKVYVYDTSGFYAGSNEVNATTLTQNQAPAAVTLSSPSYITSSSMKLTWTQNNDSDFSKYKVLYSLTSGGTLTTLATITDKSTTAVYATGLTAGTKYYFKVYVYDTGGLYAGSNEVYATTSTYGKTFGGLSSDWVNDVIKTSDGGYIAVGATYSFGYGGKDVFIVKMNAEGNKTWGKFYGTDGDDKANSVRQTSDGGYIVAGERYYAQGDEDVWVLKLYSNGEIENQNYFGSIYYDSADQVKQTADGGYIVAGHADAESKDNLYYYGGDAWVIKLDSSLNKVWDSIIGGSNAETATNVFQTIDGGYIVAGYTWSYSQNGGADIWIYKLDDLGNKLWENIFGGADDDRVKDFIQTSSNSFILLTSIEKNDVFYNWQLLGLDSYGYVNWEYLNDDAQQTVYNTAYSVASASDGGYIVVGSRHLEDDDEAWIEKLSSNRIRAWRKFYGGYNNDYFYSIANDQNAFIIAGETDSFGAGSSDAWVFKADNNGNSLWQSVGAGRRAMNQVPTPGSPALGSSESGIESGCNLRCKDANTRGIK